MSKSIQYKVSGIDVWAVCTECNYIHDYDHYGWLQSTPPKSMCRNCGAHHSKLHYAVGYYRMAETASGFLNLKVKKDLDFIEIREADADEISSCRQRCSHV